MANWLDPGGNSAGTLALRYLFPDEIPPLRYQTVAKHELAAALPPGLPRLSSDERAASLARRHRSVARRYQPSHQPIVPGEPLNGPAIDFEETMDSCP